MPLDKYIPDGEPHVFDGRLYIYGSHDRAGSAAFCLNDYVCYSADVHDLTDWRYEGVIYRKDQDPVNQNIPEDAPEQPLMGGVIPQKEEDLNPRGVHAMWAPDVARGPAPVALIINPKIMKTQGRMARFPLAVRKRKRTLIFYSFRLYTCFESSVKVFGADLYNLPADLVGNTVYKVDFPVYMPRIILDTFLG